MAKSLISKFRHFLLTRVLRIDTWFSENYENILYNIRKDLALPGDLMDVTELKSILGHCADDVYFVRPDVMTAPEKIFLYEGTNIYGGAKFIISPQGDNGKFILKAHSGASQGLTVITGLHGHRVGSWSRNIVTSRELDVDKDVIVEEDVRIGANVTLMPGVKVGRGSIIGACTVVTKDIPPYAVVAGNPARILRYKYSIEQILEHESQLYEISERLSEESLQYISKFNKNS